MLAALLDPMLLSLIVVAGSGAPGDSGETRYSGRMKQLQVATPRLDEPIDIDGVLTENAWSQAARLTEFSQYSPNDNQPADDSTEILVWYSATAIHFGVRAHAAPGTVRASLANRDKLDADDVVLFFLSTFNDGRQAMVFGVNPLGAQSDGAMVEGTRSGQREFGGLAAGRETPDLSPDFAFQSRGRLTEYGYEVEVRIPFKSLRFSSDAKQTWGFNVIRRIQNTGHEDSWAPAHRAATSFLAQSGTLGELTDLHRGLVLEFNPIVTSKVDGTPGSGGWNYDAGRPEVGGNVRWGLTTNLTLNGTIKPDFSQVESDAGQFAYDPRQALFFPEKRPFFLDGIEQFASPNQLIYTRRITQPVAATKLTGKFSGTTVALLSAVDDKRASATGDNPIFNVMRVQRDLAGQSRVGLVYTDKIDGSDYNRVAAADAHMTFGKIYTLQLQGGGSHTRRQGVTTTAPVWQSVFNRNGRHFGMRYFIRGLHDDFRAASGFIGRGGIVNANAVNQITLYGKPGSKFERWTGDVTMDGTWPYQRFVHGERIQDQKLHFNSNFTFRGGWHVGMSLLVESFGFDEDLYADYAIERTLATGVDTIPFTGVPTIPNLDYILSLNTPQWSSFSANAFVLWGHDENFFEWATASILYATLGAQWRPTDQLRVDASYQLQSFRRRTDGSTVGINHIPRLKAEYQLSRAIFFRVVGEYNAQKQDDLRDDTRTGFPILIRNPQTGILERALGSKTNTFRADWLFSLQPNPGTVFFAGYGSTLTEPDALRFRGLRRAADGFFVKFSYLFRV